MSAILRNPLRYSWQQTMLRIKDPLITVPFYERHFGFKLIHKYDFPEWNFSLYFLGIFPDDAALPEPGTEAAETFLWNMDGTCLELTHNHGTESDDNYQTNNGNVEPFRGFGHLAVATKDVYEACDELEQNGVQFQKKPNEGRMKGLAFAKDPDGYWIEIISQHSEVPVSKKFTLAQTMFRVKDPLKSLHFYRDLLGMTVVKESVHGAGTDWGFSLYFLAHLTDDEIISEPNGETRIVQNPYKPVIELTHNHGTENNPDFKYHNGNDTDAGQHRGFGHVGFLVDNLDVACQTLEAAGVAFKKKPQDGNMRGIAFAYDPDGYWVELIQRGMQN